jgi:hypothetical protein
LTQLSAAKSQLGTDEDSAILRNSTLENNLCEVIKIRGTNTPPTPYCFVLDLLDNDG